MAYGLLQTYPFVSSDLSRPIARIDPNFLNAVQNAGVTFLFDAESLTFPPAPALNVDGSAVLNLARDTVAPSLVDAAIELTAGQALALMGGGLDFSALTERNNGLLIPADVMARHHASAERHISIGLVVKLPAEVNWPATGAPRLLTFGTGGNGYSNSIDPYEIAMQTVGGIKRLRAFRQTGAANGTADILSVDVPVGALGQVCLLHYRRTAAGQRFRLFYPGGVVEANLAFGAENTQNFAPNTGLLGLGLPGWNVGLTDQAGAKVWRAYRLWIENPALSGRDPDAAAAADWVRIQARGAFS
jgi:hypothetical protein